jgi:hypothetical protein
MATTENLTVLVSVFDALLNAEGLRKSLHIERVKDFGETHVRDFIHDMDIDPELIYRIRRFEDKRYPDEPEVCYTWMVTYERDSWVVYLDQQSKRKLIMTTPHTRQLMRRLRRIDLVGID